MNKRISGLIGESVGIDMSFPKLTTEFGEYTLMDSPDKMLIPDEFQQTIKELGDTNPMFITVAVPIGTSRMLSSDNDPANDRTHRRWPEHVMDTLVDRIRENSLPGYRGHAANDSDLMSLPNAATLWLTAAKGEKLTGEKAILARGYVYDVDNNRFFVKTGAFNTVSPMAMARVKPEVEDSAPVDVVEQANWLSLDFVRKNTEGIRGAAVVSMEGAAVDMKLTPEQVKLVSELGLDVLEQYNPALVREISKSTAAASGSVDNELVGKLTDRIQTLTNENASLYVEKSILDQVSVALDVKPTELAGKITELKELQANATRLACEAAIAKLGNNPLRDVVAKRLKDVQFATAKEAEEAVAREMATAKEYVAAMGGQFGMGGINNTDQFTGGTGASGVLSEMGRSLVGGRS